MPPLAEVVPLGLGAVIAVIVLYWKRIDDQRYAERLEQMLNRRDEQQERLLAILRQNSIAIEAMTNTVDALASFNQLSAQLAALQSSLREPKE